MKMEQTECSETSAYKIQTPGNYPEENIKQFIACLCVVILPCITFKRRESTLSSVRVYV